MTKNTILLSMFLISVNAFEQVGINTASPYTSTSLELASANKALYLNRVTSTATINSHNSDKS